MPKSTCISYLEYWKYPWLYSWIIISHAIKRSLPFQRRFFCEFFLYPSFDWISACFFPPTGVVQLYQTGLNFLVLWLDDRQLAVWVTPCVCGNAFLHINSRVTHSVNLRAKKSIKKDSGTYQGVFCRESDQVRMSPMGAVTSPAPS